MFGLDRRLLVRATKKWIYIGVIGGLFSVILTMALMFMVGSMIDDVLNDIAINSQMMIWLVGILIAKGFLGWLVRLATYHASSETKLSVRDMVYDHALNLGPGVMGRKRTGEIVNTAVDGMEFLELFFGVYFIQFVIGMATPLLICLFIFTIDWVVGLTLIISIPLTPIFLGMMGRNFRKTSDRYSEVNNYMSAQFLDNLQGMTTLVLFGQGKARGKKFYEDNEMVRLETMKLLFVNQVMIFLVDWGFALGTTLVITVVSLLRLRGGFLTPGEVIAMILVSAEFAKPLSLIGEFFFAGAIGREVAKKISSFFDEEIVVNDPGGTGPTESPKASITFDNVHFAYHGTDRKALNGVSFHIKEGETVALVGASGAGKTTITNLLLRLFNSDTGTISLGGLNLEDLPLEWSRKQMALVPQNPYLFYGTFAENMRIAKEDATQEELERAAKAANIHDFIMDTPDGYDTLVGEFGMSLSGGQAQRLAVARAMLEEAPIVILDEPTSQIDVENEAVVQEAINHLTEDKTVIIIAHRLSTVEDVDRIIVMDDGEILETGSHQELLAQGGAYARMIETHTQMVEEKAL